PARNHRTGRLEPQPSGPPGSEAPASAPSLTARVPMLFRVASGTTDTERLEPGALARLLDGRYGELREQIRSVLTRPEFAPVMSLPTAEYRERVLSWAQTLADQGLTAPGFP